MQRQRSSQDIALRRVSVILPDRTGSTFEAQHQGSLRLYRKRGRPWQNTQWFPIDPYPRSMPLVSARLETVQAPHPTRRLKGNGSKCCQDVESSFLSANQRKAFTKNVTRLPNAIALLTCEWRALQQLARQNLLDLTLVAITWHIKAISAPNPPPTPQPLLSPQSSQTFYTCRNVSFWIIYRHVKAPKWDVASSSAAPRGVDENNSNNNKMVTLRLWLKTQ